MVYLAVDTGTTNTTVWLLDGEKMVRRIRCPVGVRNAPISGDRWLLHRTLRDAFASLSEPAPASPRFVLAAGMITSSLGLWELPHVVAPAGASELARHVRRKSFRAITPLPFFFVPGVRIQRRPCRLNTVEQTDIIRGEETEVVGLGEIKKCNRSWLFLHLGSHAKAILVDGRGRIVNSTSTLSGECLQVLRTQTILASRLAHLEPLKLSRRFLLRGHNCAEKNGLLRALFMVRLLEENPGYRQADLYSFLLGALAASDLRAFRSRGLLKGGASRIFLSGHPDLLSVWLTFLGRRNRTLEVVEPADREVAFLTGLRRIVFASPVFQGLRW